MDITIPSRFKNLHDTEAKWNDKPDFIPNKGEFVIYDADDNHKYQRIKIGDGVTTIVNLQFASISESELAELLNNIQNQITKNELQVSETKPSFACTWFRVTGN